MLKAFSPLRVSWCCCWPAQREALDSARWTTDMDRLKDNNKQTAKLLFQRSFVIKCKDYNMQNVILLHLYSAPRRSMSLKGKALAHGVSARSIRSPNRKGGAGKGRPSKDWNVGRTYRNPACSLLPRNPRDTKEWLRWFRSFPAARRNRKIKIYKATAPCTQINACVTCLGIPVDLNEMIEDVRRESFLLGQTLQ